MHECRVFRRTLLMMMILITILLCNILLSNPVTNSMRRFLNAVRHFYIHAHV